MPVYSKETKTGARWYVSMRAEGRKVYPPGSYATKTEAVTALRRLQVAKADGEYTVPDGKTVDGLLTWWVDTHKGLRPRTAERYRTVVRLYVSPVIGDMLLQRVTPEDVQRVIDAAETSSVYNALKAGNILRAAFGRAVQLGNIRRNPAAASSGVRRPRESTSKFQPPAHAEVMRIIEAAQGTTTYLPFAILAMTGLRRGEVLALRWTDVDLDAGELHVRRALSIVNGEAVFAEPKTERAQRAVPVTTALGRILRSAKAEQDARRLKLGQDWRDLGLVVTTHDGSPMRPEVVTHAFERLTKRLGVNLRLHDLRHAYASELLSRGVSILAVSRILGHASVAFTGDRYGHLMARDFDAVRAALSVEAR